MGMGMGRSLNTYDSSARRLPLKQKYGVLARYLLPKIRFSKNVTVCLDCLNWHQGAHPPAIKSKILAQQFGKNRQSQGEVRVSCQATYS
jgi:hypothetical protein